MKKMMFKSMMFAVVFGMSGAAMASSTTMSVSDDNAVAKQQVALNQNAPVRELSRAEKIARLTSMQPGEMQKKVNRKCVNKRAMMKEFRAEGAKAEFSPATAKVKVANLK